MEQRHEQAPEINQPQVAIDIFAVRLVKAANLGFFLYIRAHDSHAREIFLCLRGEHGERSLNFSVERMNLATENPYCDGHDRNRKQHVNAEPR